MVRLRGDGDVRETINGDYGLPSRFTCIFVRFLSLPRFVEFRQILDKTSATLIIILCTCVCVCVCVCVKHLMRALFSVIFLWKTRGSKEYGKNKNSEYFRRSPSGGTRGRVKGSLRRCSVFLARTTAFVGGGDDGRRGRQSRARAKRRAQQTRVDVRSSRTVLER